LTQKEIDRIAFDAARFDRALSLFQAKETPFLKVGGKYGDWLLGLGRTDLIEKMASRVREAVSFPSSPADGQLLFSPKVKMIDFAAYAVPINKTGITGSRPGLCAHQEIRQTSDQPRPVSGREAPGEFRRGLLVSLQRIRIHGAVAEVTSEEEGRKILDALAAVPSLIHPKRT